MEQEILKEIKEQSDSHISSISNFLLAKLAKVWRSCSCRCVVASHTCETTGRKKLL
ncbi:hypothetical protein Amet_1836 [Alkaliphilus metalliredigens QYMF]|uniref:Uncharacterized protein n=1 Tax=Alkaliphilus metalliredigens (strain QYMF) TaxID=293826 RepID=A6TP88_ALKMQ|nr:hypothetical protein Amet_1836 [Alkaliphilus metalliredigens QYMF]